MKEKVARRRRPASTLILLFLALVVTGSGYALAKPEPATATSVPSVTGDAERGAQLFQANCSTCHGMDAAGTDAGPSLIGVGAASADFQLGTGRMPMQATAPQAPKKPVELSKQDQADLVAFVASLGKGPGIPTEEVLAMLDDPEAIAEGGEIFRINCAMCHNVVGSGGALTRGKYAPALRGVESRHIYEAMVIGPQSMPVFNDENISPEEKQKLISYLKFLEEQPSAGGISLGSLGPVSEGLFVWVGAVTLIIGSAVWLGAKSS